MPAPPLDSTHGRMKSGVACHHRLWATHTVERCQAWYAIIAFGQQKLSNDVGRGMPSPPLDCMHGQTTSGVARLHCSWTAHTVGNVGCGMTSPPLDSTHDRTTSRVAFHFRLWAAHTVDDIWRGMPLLPLGSTNGRTTSSLASHH